MFRKCHLYSLLFIFSYVSIIRLLILSNYLNVSFICDMMILFMILKVIIINIKKNDSWLVLHFG